MVRMTPLASASWMRPRTCTKGDGGAFGDGDAQLIGEEAHDRGVLDPGDLLELCARCDRGTKKRLRPTSEPKTERRSARLSSAPASGLAGDPALLLRVWMEAADSMRKPGSRSRKLRTARVRATIAPRAIRTVAANSGIPQRVRAHEGMRPRRTGTRRRARRKGSPASSSGSAAGRAGREGRASESRPAGGR
jgi:hypothetical protein